MSVVDEIFAGPGIFVWGIDEEGEEETNAITFDLTQGGITFTTTTTYFEPTVDQTGTAPVKTIKTGMTGNVAFESPSIDYRKVVKFDRDVTEVVDATDNTKRKYNVTGLAGQVIAAKRALIKPQGIDDPNYYIYIARCSLKFDANYGFVLDNNLRMPVNAMAYPDLDATPKGLVYTWGDITATA
jgi:hypothetical protein